jgi:hypothetical protein
VFVAAGPLDGSGQDRIVTGADSGGGPHVAIYTADGGVVHSGWYAYSAAFTGGVRVAVCNLYGDGAPWEIVTGAGPGGMPHVRTWGAQGASITPQLMAYSTAFSGGVYVACGDLDGDGKDEIVTGAGAGGGPHVRVFKADGTPVGDGFVAYDPGFSGGVRVAVARLNGPSNPPSIITGAGPGGGPHVRVWQANGQPVGTGFFAYSPAFTGGVYVAGGDVSGDGVAEIITGAGETGLDHVRVVNAAGNYV